jgi:hypothetical protein
MNRFGVEYATHDDATFEQEFLHITVAQGEAIIEPDAVTDDCSRKAVVFVTLGAGRRGYALLPILGFVCSVRGASMGDYVMGWEPGSTT